VIEQHDKICLNCAGLGKCPRLADKKGQFDPRKVVTPEALQECPDWIPVRWLTRNVRDQLYARGGLGSLRGLFMLPDLVQDKLEKQEEEPDEMDVVDLACIIRDGMTAEERREQLRYVTDDDGNVVLDDEDQPIPRNSHEYRFFAISPDFHVGLERATGLFWRAGQVLDYIVDKELELGLITKNRKGGKTKAGKSARRETKKMGKSVTRRSVGKKKKKTGKKAGKKTGKTGKKKTGKKTGKVGKKVGKKTGKKKVSKKTGSSRPRRSKPAEEPEPVTETGTEFEHLADVQDVSSNLHMVMLNFFKAQKKALELQLEQVNDSIDTLEKFPSEWPSVFDEKPEDEGEEEEPEEPEEEEEEEEEEDEGEEEYEEEEEEEEEEYEYDEDED